MKTNISAYIEDIAKKARDEGNQSYKIDFPAYCAICPAQNYCESIECLQETCLEVFVYWGSLPYKKNKIYQKKY